VRSVGEVGAGYYEGVLREDQQKGPISEESQVKMDDVDHFFPQSSLKISCLCDTNRQQGDHISLVISMLS
jgi:hypothetical protein